MNYGQESLVQIISVVFEDATVLPFLNTKSYLPSYLD